MFYDNEMQNAPAASRALESDRHRSRAASSIHAPVRAPAAPALAGIYRPPVTRSEHREPPRDPCDTDTPPASRASDQRSGNCAQLYVQTRPLSKHSSLIGCWSLTSWKQEVRFANLTGRDYSKQTRDRCFTVLLSAVRS